MEFALLGMLMRVSMKRVELEEFVIDLLQFIPRDNHQVTQSILFFFF
jgi:hypothetical protein